MIGSIPFLINRCPGCVLTHGERNYSVAPSCGPVTAAASEVVLLVHGFYPSLWADPVTWLREFYDIKDRVLEQEYSCQQELRKLLLFYGGLAVLKRLCMKHSRDTSLTAVSRTPATRRPWFW